MRFIRVEISIYLMRMILLIGNLKLVGHSYLNPIFVSICGLSQAVAVVFKSMKSKKKEKPEGGLEVVVDSSPYTRVRIRRLADSIFHITCNTQKDYCNI